MKKLFLAIFTCVVCILWNSSCKHNPEDTVVPTPIDTTSSSVPCNPDTVYFSNEVLPLIVSSCAKSGCHDAISKAEGIIIILTDYANILRTGKIKAGNPSNSDFIEVIEESNAKDRMPPAPDAPLTATQIQLLRNWISQGAKNLNCNPNSNGCDTSKTISFKNDVQPIIDLHCKGCHSTYSPGAGIKLTTYAEINTLIVGGELIGVIDHERGFKAMPPAGNKLNDCLISKIKIWIRNGAQNN